MQNAVTLGCNAEKKKKKLTARRHDACGHTYSQHRSHAKCLHRHKQPSLHKLNKMGLAISLNPQHCFISGCSSSFELQSLCTCFLCVTKAQTLKKRKLSKVSCRVCHKNSTGSEITVCLSARCPIAVHSVLQPKTGINWSY